MTENPVSCVARLGIALHIALHITQFVIWFIETNYIRLPLPLHFDSKRGALIVS